MPRMTRRGPCGAINIKFKNPYDLHRRQEARRAAKYAKRLEELRERRRNPQLLFVPRGATIGLASAPVEETTFLGAPVTAFTPQCGDCGTHMDQLTGKGGFLCLQCG